MAASETSNPIIDPPLLRRLGLGFVVVLAFCAVSYIWFDRAVALWFKANLIEGTTEWVVAHRATDLGLGWVWLVPSGVGAILFRWAQVRAKTPEASERMLVNANAALFLFASVAGSGIVVDVLKGLIGRLRPYELFVHQAYGFQPFTLHWNMNSFPSGHGQTVFAALTALAVIAPRFKVLWLILAVLIAATRVIISVHYLSDVAMGSYCGLVGTVLLARLFAARGWRVRGDADAMATR
ncbi:MAG TPA: phosphatase PAP2 family protein [Magnetospirillaceae bacterium]